MEQYTGSDSESGTTTDAYYSCASVSSDDAFTSNGTISVEYTSDGLAVYRIRVVVSPNVSQKVLAGKGICVSDPNLSIADTLDHVGETKVTSATRHKDASTRRTAVAVTHAEHRNEVMHPSVEPGCCAPGAYTGSNTDTKSCGDVRQFTLPVAKHVSSMQNK